MSSIEELARRYWKFEEARDVDAVLRCFTADAVWEGAGLDLVGHEEIRGFYEDDKAEFAELKVEVRRVLGDQDEAAIEWAAWVRGVDGRRREQRGVNLMRRDGELIASLVCYFHWVEDPGEQSPVEGGGEPSTEE